jgi:glyoxylase-like metal-dependent hydrolase (beta-lactamase superfamily II)
MASQSDQPSGSVTLTGPDGGVNTTAWMVLSGVGATAIILLWGFIRSPAAAFDDAYITYRYADNLRQGLGLLYNPGEWVLGTTTPLFALLLGGLGLLVRDLEWLGHWLGIASWIGAAWAGQAIFRQAQRTGAAILAPLLIALQGSLLASVGMETPLLILLMLAVAWAWFGGRKVMASILAAALILTRQDSAIWLLLLGLEIWRRERKLPWREGVGAILLTLPWFVYAQWRYGSFLPNSVAAKLGQNTLMPVSGLSPFWLGVIEQGLFTLAPLAAAALLVAVLLALWAIVRGSGRGFWWLPAWIACYTIFYTLTGVVTFPWYFTPALTGVFLFAALGIGALLGDEGLPFVQRGNRGRVAAAASVALFAVLALGMGRVTYQASRLMEGYQPAYVPAARWLAENSPAGSTVATIEIGKIGYESGRHTVDTMGLVSPGMTSHQLGWQETLVYALNSRRPDYVVTLPNTAWDAVVPEWWFQREYEPVATFDNVTLYQRSATDDGQYEAFLAAELAQGIALTGISSPAQQLPVGGELDLDVHLRVDATPAHTLLMTAYLIDAQTFERVAAVTDAPFSGRYDSKLWQPGDWLRVPVRLSVPADLPAGAYRVGLTVFDAEENRGLPARDDPAGPPPDLQAGWFRAGAPETELPAGQMQSLPTTAWADGIVLESLAVPAEALAPGESLPVQLRWRVTQPVARDLTLFVHLTNGDGEIVSQYDALPAGGRWPTTVWQAGDLLAEEVIVTLPADLSPGEYSLRVGLYDAAGRLPLANGSADNWLLQDVVSVGQE